MKRRSDSVDAAAVAVACRDDTLGDGVSAGAAAVAAD